MCSGNCSPAPRWPIEKSVFLRRLFAALLQRRLERTWIHIVDEKIRPRPHLDVADTIVAVVLTIIIRR